MAEQPTIIEKKQQQQKRMAEVCLRLLGTSDFNLFLDDLAERLIAQREANELMRGEERTIGTGIALGYREVLGRVDQAGTVMARVRQAEFRRIRGLKQ